MNVMGYATVSVSLGAVAARSLAYPTSIKPGNDANNPRVLRAAAVNTTLNNAERAFAALRRKFNSKGMQAFHTVISFSLGTFDPDDPDDQDRALELGIAIAKHADPPGTPSTIVVQADGETGCLHIHKVSCTTIPRDCELNGKIWRAGRKIAQEWTNVYDVRERANAAMATAGFTNLLVNDREPDVVMTKIESGIFHRQRMYDQKAAEGTLKPGQTRPEDSWRLTFIENLDAVYLADPRSVTWDGLREVLNEHGHDVTIRTKKDGTQSATWSIAGHGRVRGFRLGNFAMFGSVDAMLQQNAQGEPRRRLKARQSDPRPPKKAPEPTPRELDEARKTMQALAQAERDHRDNEEFQNWLVSRQFLEPESLAERLWQKYGAGALDDEDWAALRDQMSTWKAALTANSGVEVPDRPGLVQTAEISVEEASDDSPDTLDAAPWPRRGQEGDTERPELDQEEATQFDRDLESAENASPAMSSSTSTTSTADAARSWPHSGHEVDTLRPESGHDLARWHGSLDADAATESPSAPAPVAPSTDAPALVSVEADSVVPTAHPGLADAPALGRPSSGAPALDDEGAARLPDPDRPANAPALAGAGVPSAPAPVPPYRSGVRDLRGRDEKAQQTLHAIAAFDEQARLTLAAGGRIPNGEVPKGIGAKWLATYGDRLDPVVRHELLLRAERMTERREAFEAGKALKARLDQFGEPGFTLDEYRDIERRLAASNAKVRLLEQRMVAGIYEHASWRPGHSISDRGQSRSMGARLHELAEQALDDHSSVELPDQEFGS